MSKKILVVDDSVMVRNIHTFILKSAGYEVLTASNGYEGLEVLFQDNFSLIATDINMPKMDGLKFIEEIRKDNQYKATPIIIISTESEAKDKSKGFKAGANIYVIKPVKPEEFLLNVKMLIG